MQLSGLHVLITGGASGMGAAVAKTLYAAGAHISLLDLDFSVAEAWLDDIQAEAIIANVTDEAGIAEGLAQASARFGVVRVLVNCAGICPAARMVGRDGPMALELFKRVVDINLVGSFNTMRLMAAGLMAADCLGEERGVIINTASIAAFDGQIGQAAYSASKGGLVAMTLPLARELAKHAIRVMTIAPGLVDTPMMAAMPAEVRQSLGEMVPFPSRLAKPEEFAALVQHIIENPMLNGEVIRLDGAIRMQPK